MFRICSPITVVATIVLIFSSAPLRADVESYFAQLDVSGAMKLAGVTIRNGAQRTTYDAKKLIGCRVTAFKSPVPETVIVVGGNGPPESGKCARLLGDGTLNTGLINPGGQDQPLAKTPVVSGPHASGGFAVQFDQPVVNRPGDDVVLFEFHRELNSPIGGDAFFVSPLRFAPGLRTATFDAFDIQCDDSAALPLAGFDVYRLKSPPSSFSDLTTGPFARTNGAPLEDFQILAVGIDFSELGFPEGTKVTGLFFQDKSGRGLMLDPVLCAGLPMPDSENLLTQIPEKALQPPAPHALLNKMRHGPMEGVEEIVFAVRVTGFDHWYANFGYYSASTPEYPPQHGIEGEVIPPLFGEGGRLCRLNLTTKHLTVLLDDPEGSVRDPQVHYAGRKIVFSYRRATSSYYHLYQIGIDGTGLRQLTDGPYDDIEPTYTPNGTIIFCSSRCNRFVNCHRTPVAVLYRCNEDGSQLQPLSTNIEHDNTPWMLPDGRVLFMRWEYVDRSQFCFHHLWTANPDGTGQMIYYGNQFRQYAMLDAKPIPGTNQVVASFSPGHGRPGHMGAITIVDPTSGPDAPSAARRISKPGKYFRDPYAFSADCFLVADQRGLHLMDGAGNTELVYKLPAEDLRRRLQCQEPRPLVSRPRERSTPDRTDLTETTGRLFLSDIYLGRNMQGIARGEIKQLLVLEQLPKPISFSGGMWPISAGGTFTLSRLLGTIPVADDGSAYMELPAMRSLFFVALDEHGRSVKRMQSFLSLEPGEVTSCVGCHEQRGTTPPANARPSALKLLEPSRISPVDGIPDVIDFPRDVQPILDKHCIECHSPDRPEGGIDLCGDHTPLFAQSYWTLLHHGLISDGRNEEYGNRAPRSIGSSASRLLDLVDENHQGVALPARDRDLLRLWIDSSAVYAGTYAALGSGMHPVEFPLEIMERRCRKCHAQPAPKTPIGDGPYFRFGSQGPHLPLVHRFTDLQQIRGQIGYYKMGNARPPQSLCNLTRPAYSLLLRAPLARRSGGLGLCGIDVFAHKEDPDYLAILDRIEQASQLHAQEKRFDMPGFRPNVYYVRMLQRYGVLPHDLPSDTPIDFRKAEESYWRQSSGRE